MQRGRPPVRTRNQIKEYFDHKVEGGGSLFEKHMQEPRPTISWLSEKLNTERHYMSILIERWDNNG